MLVMVAETGVSGLVLLKVPDFSEYVREFFYDGLLFSDFFYFSGNLHVGQL
jgi:uncharacterized membrane protein